MRSPDTPSTEEVVSRLRTALLKTPAQSAYLFGSWGRGDANRHSDLDVAVVCETPRPFLERHRDFDSIYELPWAIDLLVYRPSEVSHMERRGNRFIRNVTREGVMIL